MFFSFNIRAILQAVTRCTVLLLLGTMVVMPIQIRAQSQSCAAVSQAAVTPNVGQLFQPMNFLPLVPEECAEIDGKARPLAITDLGYVMMRLYYFLSSLTFTLFALSLFYFGLMYMIKSVTDDGNVYEVRKQIGTAVTGLVLVLSAYLIVSTIASFFELELPDIGQSLGMLPFSGDFDHSQFVSVL